MVILLLLVIDCHIENCTSRESSIGKPSPAPLKYDFLASHMRKAWNGNNLPLGVTF